MIIQKDLLPEIYNELWNQFKIGLSDAQFYLNIIIEEDYFKLSITRSDEIKDFVGNTLKNYFFPQGFDRRKIYDQIELRNNAVELEEIGTIPDGWNLKLYFDKKNNLHWEDFQGRSTEANGLKLSPYCDPQAKYGI